MSATPAVDWDRLGWDDDLPDPRLLEGDQPCGTCNGTGKIRKLDRRRVAALQK